MVDDLLERRARQARTELEGALTPAPPAIADVRRRARIRHGGVLAAAALLVLSTTAVAVRAGRSPGEVSVVAGPSVKGSGLLGPGQARPLSRSPLSGRSTMASVWTGTEMLVWGGEGPGGKLGDGAAYDPRKDAWRQLPPGPLSPRSAPAAVWTGTEMLLWGGYGNGTDNVDGAAFDPAAGTWRSITAGPMGSGGMPPAVWTGREMIVLAGLNGRGAAAYDPTTNTWRVLPEPPGQVQAPDPTIVWTGTQVVAAFLRQGGLSLQADVFALDPAGTGWTGLPRPGEGHIRLARAGDRLIAVAGDTAAAHDPATNRWVGVAQGPKGFSPGTDVLVWTGTELLLWRGGGVAAAIDPARRTWLATPAGKLSFREQPAAVWADGVLLVWGGFRNKSDGQMLRPRLS